MLEGIRAILNFFVVSIWEEISMVVLCVLFLWRLDYFSFKLMPRLLGPVIVTAGISNILRYICKTDQNVIAVVFLLTLFVSMLVTVRWTKETYYPKNLHILMVFLSAFFAVIISLLFEIPYSLLLFKLFPKTVNELNSDVALNAISAAPLRLIMYLLLGIVVFKAKKRGWKFNVSFLETAKKNKCVLCTTIFIAVFDVMWLLVFGRYFSHERALSNMNMPLLTQILIVSGFLIVPIALVIVLVVSVYGLKYNEVRHKDLDKKRIACLVNIIQMYTDQKAYDKIDLVLKDVDKYIVRENGDK